MIVDSVGRRTRPTSHALTSSGGAKDPTNANNVAPNLKSQITDIVPYMIICYKNTHPSYDSTVFMVFV